MRLPLFLLGFAAVSATAARAGDDCLCWTPSAEDIAGLEANIADHPLPFGSLDRYARYYAGTTFNGRFLRGKLVPIGGNDAPGIHVVEGMMRPLQGEGCVTESESGSGPRLYIKCTGPGAWIPSDGQIAELEGLLQLPEGHLLEAYARHYAGVTQGDRQIVIGVVMPPGWWRHYNTAGIHIVSEVELPPNFDSLHSGCRFVYVRYDPSSKEVWSRCSAVWGSTKF